VSGCDHLASTTERAIFDEHAVLKALLDSALRRSTAGIPSSVALAGLRKEFESRPLPDREPEREAVRAHRSAVLTAIDLALESPPGAAAREDPLGWVVPLLASRLKR